MYVIYLAAHFLGLSTNVQNVAGNFTAETVCKIAATSKYHLQKMEQMRPPMASVLSGPWIP